MKQKKTRIGLIGYGQIGKSVHKMINDNPDSNMEVVFVHDQITSALKDLPKKLILGNLEDFEKKKVDLVVEMAHPEITRKWGTFILERCDYLLVSVTAMADPEMENRLKETALKHGTRCFIPHGGVVGMDALFENRSLWESVDIVMKKPPKNIDYAVVGINPDDIKSETVLYDGPTRGICPKFPRNVNTHAAIALAGIGFDRTHSLLVVDPALTTAIVSIHAKAPGLTLRVERSEAISGVTGASTPASIYNSIQTIGSKGPGIHLR